MRKTYYCKECDEEFTGLISVHRKCGKLGGPVNRSRLSEVIDSGHAPGIGKANFRIVNKMVEQEFEARRISNFTNVGGEPKITHAGSYGGQSVHGFYQPPIAASWGKRDTIMQQSPVHQMFGYGAPQIGSGEAPQQSQPANTIPWSKMVPQMKLS